MKIFLLMLGLGFAAAAQEKPDPKSLTFTKWTPDFEVPNPVAISFDENGIAYVSTTERRKANDLDIRNNRDWIPNDLSFTSSEEKRAFYREKFTPENSEANKKRVKDFNQDGSHDLKDLQALTDRIYRIEDTTGDGLADSRAIYADGFQDEIAGIAAGVLFHEGNVYTTIVPDVWKLRDTTGNGKADQRESIAHGFGVHLAYAGHDMHGLTVGPDGRIYWTIGDKGLNVTSREGLNFKFPNHGAVLRCEPDGSNFEVYARGLRNVQELAFDQFGNLFGIDNDSDNAGEKERFVHIVRHMDAGWRANWQYRKPDYNPWMAENMSVPFQAKNQPAHIVPPISLYENGPAGLVFNPGTALGPAWRNYFFHTSAPNGQQWAFQVRQKGASFEMINDIQIGNGVPIVGLNFGPDGALYGVDWGGGYPLNEKGAVWKWDVANYSDNVDEIQKNYEDGLISLDQTFAFGLRIFTAKVLREAASKKANPAEPDIHTDEELAEMLAWPDQRVRFVAQFELVNRNALTNFESTAKNTEVSKPIHRFDRGELDKLARIHAIWGIGQLNRQTDTPKFETLVSLLDDSDPEIRTQAAKVLGDNVGVRLARHEATGSVRESTLSVHERTLLTRKLTLLLRDESDRVKFEAAMAIGNLGMEEGAEPILKMIDELDDVNFPYLRHAAAVGLAGCASTEFLESIYDEDFELEHAVAVVALRRRGDPAVAKFLNALTSGVSEDAARAIHDDWTIPEAMPALAEALEKTDLINSEPFIRRATNANLMLGKSVHAERVAAFASRTNVPEILRLDALDALANWTEPPILDRVVGRYRDHGKRDPNIAKNAVAKHLAAWLTDANPKIQTEAMALARGLKIEIEPEILVAVAKNSDSLIELRIEALRGLASQKSDQLSEILRAGLSDKNAKIRIESLNLFAKIDRDEALNHAKEVIVSDVEVSEKQPAIRLLAGDLKSEIGDQILETLVAGFDVLPAGLQLDIAETATTRKIKNAPAPDFSHTLEGGDSTRGEQLFMNHIAAQCIRCHKVKDGKGSNIGPNLKWIGRKKDRAYLLESLIDPQKTIAKGYGTISLTLKDGTTVAGQFRKEENGVIEIRDPENKVTKVKSDDVKERTDVISTMPPMTFLQKSEVRDLIEYLASLRAPEQK